MWGRKRAAAVALVVVLCGAGDAGAATITVSATNDALANDGACSLREAVIAANTDTASGAAAGECPAGDGVADTVQLAATTYTLTIDGSGEDAGATGDLDVRGDLTIRGPAGGRATIAGNNVQFPDGCGWCDRVLDIGTGVTATVQRVEVTRGRAAETEPGGGILNNGSLTLEDSYVSENVAGPASTSALGGTGGGIHSAGPMLSITRSRIFSNEAGYGNATNPVRADGAYGGGVSVAAGTVTIDASTLHGNWGGKARAAATFGGGGGSALFFTGAATTVDIVNTTIAENHGGLLQGDPTQKQGASAMWVEGGTVTVRWSTLGVNLPTKNGTAVYIGARKMVGPPMNGGTVSVTGNLFIGAGIPCYTPGPPLGIGVTSGGGNVTEIGPSCEGGPSTVNSKTDVLADYGGATWTRRLQTDSIAVDAAAGVAGCPATDQRGFPRPQLGGCDAGAFELRASTFSLPAAPFDLGSAAIGAAAATKTIRLSRTGGESVPAPIGAVTVGGADAADVAITSNACTAATLAVGAGCDIGLRLTPGAAGARSATLTIAIPKPGADQTLALAGTGTAPSGTGDPGGTPDPGNPGATTDPGGATSNPVATPGAAGAPAPGPAAAGSAVHTYRVTLSPRRGSGRAKSRTRLTATVTRDGKALAKAAVLFKVTGATKHSSRVTSSATGKAVLSYVPRKAGTDRITACLDLNGNRRCDTGEVRASTTRTVKRKKRR